MTYQLLGDTGVLLVSGLVVGFHAGFLWSLWDWFTGLFLQFYDLYEHD